MYFGPACEPSHRVKSSMHAFWATIPKFLRICVARGFLVEHERCPVSSITYRRSHSQ